MIKAPWTPEQVKNLRDRQQNPFLHPYTCGKCRMDLHATTDGWTCPIAGCDYTQNWANAVDVTGEWRKQVLSTEEELRELGLMVRSPVDGYCFCCDYIKNGGFCTYLSKQLEYYDGWLEECSTKSCGCVGCDLELSIEDGVHSKGTRNEFPCALAINLNLDSARIVHDLIANPPEPNQALKRAMQRRRDLLDVEPPTLTVKGEEA